MTHKCLLNCRQNYRTACITIVMIARCCLSLNVMNTAGERCFHLLAAMRRNSSISNKITKTVTIRASDVAAVWCYVAANVKNEIFVVERKRAKSWFPIPIFGQRDNRGVKLSWNCGLEPHISPLSTTVNVRCDEINPVYIRRHQKNLHRTSTSAVQNVVKILVDYMRFLASDRKGGLQDWGN